jgi:hypothetical protein
MKRMNWVLVALALLASNAALARTPEPVRNFVDQPVATASGKAMSLEQVQAAIRTVAVQQQWIVGSNPNGSMVATKSWKAHTIVVEIAANPDRYSLKYANSINMKYSLSMCMQAASCETRGIPDGTPIIHPYYNRYVTALNNGIRVELMRY